MPLTVADIPLKIKWKNMFTKDSYLHLYFIHNAVGKQRMNKQILLHALSQMPYSNKIEWMINVYNMQHY